MTPQNSHPRATVLLVDDEPHYQHLVSRTLDAQYQLFTAYCGEEGLQLAISKHPDLILLNLQVPDIDGYEVCRRLKQNPTTADTPILVMSVQDQPNDELLAYQAGCNDYLIKPFNREELSAKVNTVLQLHAVQSMHIQQLADLMPQGISIRDANGTLLLVNQRLADFLGQDKQQLIGKNLKAVIRETSQTDRMQEQDRRILLDQDGLVIAEEQLHDCNNQPRILHITKTRYSISTGPTVLTVSTDITAQKRAERAMREGQQRLVEAERLADIGSWEWDLLNDTFHWSDNLYRLLHATRETLPAPHWDTVKSYFLPEEYPLVRSTLQRAVESGEPYSLEHQMVRGDGVVLQVHAKAEVIKDRSGQPVRVRGTVQDITARKQQETWQKLTALMFTQLTEAVIVTDADKRILEINQAFTHITGYGRKEAIGKTPALLRSQHHGDTFYSQLWQQLNDQGSWQGEIWNRRKDGSLYPSWLSISALQDERGEVTHYVGISRDLSENKKVQERLHYLTNYDIQTGLPNRNLLINELDEAIEHSKEAAQQVALMAIQLNDFNLINESLSYRTGDAYIAEVAKTLQNLAPWKNGVGRIDTNILGVILPDLESPKQAVPTIHQILKLNESVVTLQQQEIPVSLNVGLSVYPTDGLESDLLLERAVSAINQSLSRGRGTFEYYAPGMNSLVQTRLQIQAELYKAMQSKAFYLHYQPKLDFSGGEITGAEALLRWQHPLKGPIPPGDFIPVAEECGLIKELGAWVLQESCRQAKIWHDEGILRGPIAVNLSTVQLQDQDLEKLVQSTLSCHQLPPQMLELEITESALMSNPDQAIKTLQGLHKIGVGLSLDDFGTGHSSLHYLSRLPIDKIKIDRSFVQRCLREPEDALIIKSIIGMARGMKLKTVAEGVETAQQFAYLKKKQCDELQGYYYSKPLDAAAFATFAKNNPRIEESHLNDHQQRTLLLVDDEPNVLQALKRLLRREGYRILTAHSGQEAKELLKSQPAEVVVCDQRMPDMNGSEFFSQIKQVYPNTVRIMLSGYTNFDAITRAINEGEIYKFLAKPWVDEELLETLRSAFDKYELES